MTESKPIFLRAHTEIVKLPTTNTAKAPKSMNGTHRPHKNVPKWPEFGLIFDCETTTDARQALTFGFYRFCRLVASSYVAIEEGILYADDLAQTDPTGFELLRQYVALAKADTPEGYPQRLRLLSRSELVERCLWGATCARALTVGFNLPFDLSRIAIDNKDARHRNETWSLVMFQDKCPESGFLRENPFRPRVIVTPLDSKAAFIRLAGVSKRSKKSKKRLVPYNPGRLLDLRSFGWALRNQSYSLQGACEAFGVPGKLDHQPTGHISEAEVEYCRQDVRSTVALLNAMRIEFDRHPIDLRPDHAYSPASIAKAYLKAMGLVPPALKFNLPGWVAGAAMQAYYGGRAECRIRHTAVPIVHTDFLSEYPTVNTLMGLWSMLIAKELRIEDATEDIRSLLAEVEPDTVSNPDFWKRLSFFALVRPDGDVLPVRTTYNGEATNIGVNALTSENPIWCAGPDLVTATLLTGKPPQIIRAFRIVPEGQQPGLVKVRLRGEVEIDPRSDDFFQKVIEARARVKADTTMPKAERVALSYFLKILANAGSYGLFVEVNPEGVGTDPKTGNPARAKLRVLSGESDFEQTSPIIEKPGSWYCPPIASLITAGGRLLLALLERMVTDAGGIYLFCDTDSMAIVASKNGGLVPCVGGPYHLQDERDAVKALSRQEVQNIVAQFEKLNPYTRNAVRDSILKIEDVNYRPDGTQQELSGYGIAAKRYVLFTRTEDGGIQIEKASAHGLGFLYSPKSGFDSRADAPLWVVEAWEWVLQGVLGMPQTEQLWFDFPAMMRFTITTPEVLKVLQARQLKLPYRDRTKPFNFVLCPIIDQLMGGHPIGTDPNRFTLVAPFSSNPNEWYRLSYVNVHDGRAYRLACPGKRMSYEAEAKTYGDVVSQYRWHPEAKSLAPDGGPRTSHTEGLLRRTRVTADGFRYVGKETDRHWEQGEDISMLDPFTLEYHPNETAKLVTDLELQRKARKVSIRVLAKKASVSEKTVKSARRGQRLRKSTIDKLKAVLNRHKSPSPDTSCLPVTENHEEEDLK